MFENKVILILDCNNWLNSYDIYLEILFARMIVFNAFIGSISITFVLFLLFVINHNLNSKYFTSWYVNVSFKNLYITEQ